MSAVVAAAPVSLLASGPVAASHMESPRRRPIGGAGNQISAGFIKDLDSNPEVRGAKWRGEPGKIGYAGKMLRDPHVRMSINYVTNPMTAAVWRFQPTSKAPIDVEAANFLTWAFFDQLPWSKYLRRIALSYFSSGFALEEMTDDVRPVPSRFALHPGGGRGLLPTAFHQRPAWSVYRWEQSKNDPSQLASVQQWLGGSDVERAGFVNVPADRLIRFTWDQEGADFDGLAPLRSAYPAWLAKIAFMTIDAIAHERHGVGTPYAIAGPNAADEDLDAAEQILAELRSMEKQYALFDNGWTFDWKSGSSGTDLHQAILRCNQDIAINVGAGHMMLGQVGPGSYALAGSQEGQLHRETDAHARFISTVMHRGDDGWSPVERILRANYGDDVEVPKPKAFHLPTKNWESIAKTYSGLISTGALRRTAASEDAIREAMDLPPFDEEIGAPQHASQSASLAVVPTDPAEPVDENADPEATPDNTTAKEDQTIFGYHLQYGIAKINEARTNLNLPEVPYGNQTVPEFLAALTKDGAEPVPPEDDKPIEEEEAA